MATIIYSFLFFLILILRTQHNLLWTLGHKGSLPPTIFIPIIISHWKKQNGLPSLPQKCSNNKYQHETIMIQLWWLLINQLAGVHLVDTDILCKRVSFEGQYSCFTYHSCCWSTNSNTKPLTRHQWSSMTCPTNYLTISNLQFGQTEWALGVYNRMYIFQTLNTNNVYFEWLTISSSTFTFS